MQNVLADTLSRLIELNEDVQQPAEEAGYEFGYTPFEELPPVKVAMVAEIIISEVNQSEVTITHKDPVTKDLPVELPLTDLRMMELQEQDPTLSRLKTEWSTGRLDRNHFTMEKDILRKKTIINGILYKPILVPDILKDCLLMLAHKELGHNGFKRTYNALRYTYHWKGMKPAIQRHCTRCITFAKHNIKVQQLQKEHFKVPPQPMEFIAMDLIGEFHPASSKGNRYALTAVCMLTSFTFCIPIKSKKAEDVVNAYMSNICCVFEPSKK